MRLEVELSGKLMLLGLPMAFQNFIIAIGSMIVQRLINSFGVIFIAGFTATNKLYGILEIAAVSLLTQDKILVQISLKSLQ